MKSFKSFKENLVWSRNERTNLFRFNSPKLAIQSLKRRAFEIDLQLSSIILDNPEHTKRLLTHWQRFHVIPTNDFVKTNLNSVDTPKLCRLIGFGIWNFWVRFSCHYFWGCYITGFYTIGESIPYLPPHLRFCQHSDISVCSRNNQDPYDLLRTLLRSLIQNMSLNRLCEL